MNRQAVTSSTILSIGYDAESQTLEIEFANSGIYQYFDLPQGVYDDLISADSQGKYLAQNIKGYYRYSRV